MESSTLPDPKLVAASGDFIGIAAHSGKQHDGQSTVKGKCPIYRNIECDDHERTAEVATEYIKGSFVTPMTIWADGTGKEIFRRGGYREAGDVAADLKIALEKMPGARVTRADYDLQAGPLSDGEIALANEKWKTAIDKLTAASKGKLAALTKISEQHLARIKAVGEKLLAEGKAYLDADGAKAARPYFKLLSEEFQLLDCGKQGAELLKSIDVSDK